MTLQFTEFGAFIIFIFYTICAALLGLLFYLLRYWKKRARLIWPLAIILLLLPYPDELWIAWKFNELCKDAGEYVYRKVEVDGYYDDTATSAYGLIEKYGYKYMEYRTRTKGKYKRLEMINGKWIVTEIDELSSRYHYKKPIEDKKIGFQLTKTEYVVIDTALNETIGRRTLYERYPGWVEGIWIRFLGSGMTMCPSPTDASYQYLFPQSVFISSKK